MSENKIHRQFGLWDSPISAQNISKDLDLVDVAWEQDGTLLWMEKRPDRGVVVVQPSDGQAFRELNNEYSVRGHLNYGGGEFTVGHRHVYFVSADSGRIYRQPSFNGIASPVTPAFGGTAAPALSPDGDWLIYVRTYEDQDSIDIVDYQGKLWPQKLVFGDDFYMYPTWHPDGERIAWIAWNHPNMPWDSTFLRIGTLSKNPGGASTPVVANIVTVAGDQNSSVLQPVFSPDGRYLAYVSDESGWWNIYLYELDSCELQQVTTGKVEHGMPAWLQGLRTFSFAPDGSAVYFIRNESGFASLWRHDIASGNQSRLDLGSEYTWFDQPSVAPDGERVAMIASSSKIPKRLIVYHTATGALEVRRRSSAEDIPTGFYSQPQPIAWTGMDGGDVYGLYYPPQNPMYTSDGLPPLVLLVHGGPTSQRNAAYDAQVPFFTSRGYAVLQVNFRGSTGYGRAYRNMLRGNWGIYDVQDSVSGARYLVEQGWVDENRLVIMGGSSGGFTVLKALEDYPGFFKAGINLYGVSNQFTLASDTHKFESHYSDMLIGTLPEAVDLYYERSPVFFADKIQDPLAIFQGENDQVVIRSQSDEVVESLKSRGVPYIYHVYAGEGHGFRKSETIQHFYESVDNFLRQYVVYA